MAFKLKRGKQTEQALELVKNSLQQSKNFQSQLFTKFVEYYKVYRAVNDDKKQAYHGRANLFIPYAYSIVETIYPRMLSSKPKIFAYPREKQDIIKAKLVEKVIDWEWYMINADQVVRDWVKQALIYGTGIVKIFWDYNENKQTDKPEIINVDLFDFYIDPHSNTVKNSKYVIHRCWRDLESLKKDENYKLPLELVGIQQELNEFQTQRDAITNQNKQKTGESKMVELHEYWGSFDINGDGIDKECLLVMADNKYIVRAEENPFKHKQKPFVEMADIKIPQEFWGLGEIESVLSLQYELNDTRNQRMDNVTQILSNRPIVSRQAGVENYEVENWTNGKVLFVNGHPEAAVGYNRPPDVTGSAYNEETMIKGDLTLVSGINDLAPMVAGKNVRALQQTTATGAELQAEEANSRFRAKLLNLEDALSQVGKLLVELNKQYWNEEKVIRIIGEGSVEFMNVKPEDISGEYDIIIQAGASQSQSRQVRRNEALELFQTLAPIAQVAGINVQALIKNVLDTYEIANAEEILGGGQQGLPVPAPAGMPQVPASMSAGEGGGAINIMQ